jgi:hypothetical protein
MVKGFYWTQNAWKYNGNVTLSNIIVFDLLDPDGYYGLLSEEKNKGCALPIRCVKK